MARGGRAHRELGTLFVAIARRAGMDDPATVRRIMEDPHAGLAMIRRHPQGAAFLGGRMGMRIMEMAGNLGMSVAAGSGAGGGASSTNAAADAAAEAERKRQEEYKRALEEAKRNAK